QRNGRQAQQESHPHGAGHSVQRTPHARGHGFIALDTKTTGKRTQRSENHAETLKRTRHNSDASWQAPTQGKKADCISRCNLCDVRDASRIHCPLFMRSSFRSACATTQPPLLPLSLPVATVTSPGGRKTVSAHLHHRALLMADAAT
ncbi:hypothetical protein TcG_04115, partial [Trypanosoma cruzi]